MDFLLLDLYKKLEAKGIQISLKAWAAASGIDLERDLNEVENRRH